MTCIDLSKHVQTGKLRNRPAELDESSRRDGVARATQASPLLPFPNPTHQNRLTSFDYSPRERGSSASRRPSPSRLKPRTAKAMATPGTIAAQGANCRKP